MAIKKYRGGKYSADGYFGENVAGNPRQPNPNTAGEKQEIGTGSRKYTFYREDRGTLTIWANSFEEAWRLAKARGYHRRNYKR